MSKVNLVNAYFDGELTKAQVTDFENQLKNDTKSKSIISNLIIQRSYKSKEDQPFPKYVNIAFYTIY